MILLIAEYNCSILVFDRAQRYWVS